MSGFSRRGVLFGAACALGCTAASAGPGRLTCDDAAASPALALGAAEQERHGIFAALAMALVFDNWGVDRSRPELVAAYEAAEPGRVFADYPGHNIGAVLVDRTGSVICGALNRNVQLNSTLEHAEARTVARAIQLANQKGSARWSFGALLEGDCLYTTLEPCAQCAGIIELGNIAGVVYGQADPAQFRIVNVLFNLRRQGGEAAGTVPIEAGFAPFWAPLAAAYARFQETAPTGARTGLTAFLQTVEAYLVFRAASEGFERMSVSEAGNETLLLGAQAFRSRWRDAMRADGVAPAIGG